MPRRVFAFLSTAALLAVTGNAFADEPAPAPPLKEPTEITAEKTPTSPVQPAASSAFSVAPRFHNTAFPVRPLSSVAPASQGPATPVVAGAHVAAGHVAAGQVPADSRPKMAPFVVKRWYGWQPLVADGATFTAASAFRSPGILFVGYAVGAPTIHLLHGQPVRAVKSLGIRLAIPAAAALVGCAASDAMLRDKLAHPCVEGASFGLLAGMATAIAIDASTLSFDPSRAKDVAVNKRTTTALLPGVAFVSGGARVEVRGTF